MSSTARLLVVVVMVPLLTHAEAEWPATRGCATRAGVYEGGLPTNLTLHWLADTSGSIVGDPAFVGVFVIAPIEVNGGVYLHAWNRSTGELAYVLDEHSVRGGAVATASRIVAATPGEAWISWNHDGTDSRRFPLPAPAISAPALVGNDAFFSLEDGTLAKVAVGTGETAWTQSSGGSPAWITPERVIVSTETRLVAYDHEGGVEWTIDADGVGGVAIGDGGVFFTSDSWSLGAVSLATGEPRWISEFVLAARSATLVYAGGLVLVHGFDDSLRAIDALSGDEKWAVRPQEEADGGPSGGQKQDHNVPVAADGHRVALSRHAGGLEVRDLSSGELIESHDLDRSTGRRYGPVAQGNQTAVPLDGAIAMFQGQNNADRDCMRIVSEATPDTTPPTSSASPDRDSPPVMTIGSLAAIFFALGVRRTR